MIGSEEASARVPGVVEFAVGAARVFWLPASVAIAEDAIEAKLSAEERGESEPMRAASRRNEYRRSRYLLRMLTSCDATLPRTSFGGPSWPEGLVGSLTHKDGHVGLTLAPRSELASLGLDAEDTGRVHLGLADKICSPKELGLLAAVAGARGEPVERWLAALFAFKEAIFKAVHPLGGMMFYFHDAAIVGIEPDKGLLKARIGRDVAPTVPCGIELTGTLAWRREGAQELAVVGVLL